MKNDMTSRERLLAAMSLEETDHLPFRLLIMNSYPQLPFKWSNQFQRVDALRALGLDDAVWLEPPGGYVENHRVQAVPSDVRLYQRGERDPGYPVLEKVYHCEGTPLTTAVKVTEDWPHGGDIPIFSDFNVSRAIKHLITDPEDIKGLRQLLVEPDSGMLKEFRDNARQTKAFAQSRGVAVEGGWMALGDAVVWLMGMEQAMVGQLTEPELLAELLDVIGRWEDKRTEILLDAGVDILVSMAWYEGVDTYVPRIFERYLLPGIQRRSEMARAAGSKHRYIITRRYRPILRSLVESGIDCLTGFDPVQDDMDWDLIEQLTRGKISIMGGLNASVMLTRWTEDEIRRAVASAVKRAKALPGFVLYPVDQIFEDTCWDKAATCIDEWKRLMSDEVLA